MNLQLAMGDGADEKRVDHRHRPGLGRREDAEADADEDEDRDRERPDRVLEGAAELRTAHEALPAGQVATPAGDEGRGDHQRPAEHDARDDAADEEAADRDVGQEAVDDEADAGRDDGRDDGCRRGDGGDEGRRVTALHHLGTEHLRLHRRIGIGGGREPAHQGRQDDVRLGQPAHPMADQRVGQHHEAAGDAGIVHDGAGEDEEGHRQEGIGVGGAHQLLDIDADRRCASQHKKAQGGDGHCEGDGHVDAEHGEHQHERQPGRHQTSPPRRRRTSAVPWRMAIIAKPTVTER